LTEVRPGKLLRRPRSPAEGGQALPGAESSLLARLGLVRYWRRVLQRLWPPRRNRRRTPLERILRVRRGAVSGHSPRLLSTHLQSKGEWRVHRFAPVEAILFPDWAWSHLDVRTGFRRRRRLGQGHAAGRSRGNVRQNSLNCSSMGKASLLVPRAIKIGNPFSADFGWCATSLRKAEKPEADSPGRRPAGALALAVTAFR